MKSYILILISLFLYSCNFSQDNKPKIRFTEKQLNSPTQNEKAMSYYNQGYEAFHKEDYRTAISFYRAAIKYDSAYTDAYDNLGLSYRRLNILDSAEFFYIKSLSILPTNLIALNNLALVYVHEGNLDKAELTYLQILKIDSTEPDGYYGLADIYYQTSKFELSIRNGLKAYELWKQSNKIYAGDAISFVGVSYLSLNDKKNAKKYFSLASSLGRNISSEYLKQTEE